MPRRTIRTVCFVLWSIAFVAGEIQAEMADVRQLLYFAAITPTDVTEAGPGVDQRRGNWNQFRGPHGDGKTLAKSLPIHFSETNNVRWKTPIHDEGNSSPVVWND